MSNIHTEPGSQPSAKALIKNRVPNRRSGVGFWARLWAQRELMIMLIPGVLYYIIFHYVPIYGLKLAFIDYSPFLGYDGSPWVGFAHFERLFGRNIDLFWRLLKNTLTLSVLNFGITFPITIIFALILNEVRAPKMKKAYQTVSYLPTFLSGVIVASIFIELFSVKSGPINKIIEMFGGKPINFLHHVEWYYVVYVLSGLWATVGSGAIIYLSALAGVDQEMYEAADIDGCSRLKRIWHITLPAIGPTVMTMFLLNIGNMIRIAADKTMLLRTDMIINDTHIFSTYVYDMGIAGGDISYTAAIGMFESVVSAILMFTFNYIAKKRTGTSIW